MKEWVRNIFILLLLCTSLTSFAQGGRPHDGRGRREVVIIRRPNGNKKLDEVKKSYLAQHLVLSPQQSERFWPIYDQYQSELDEVLSLRRANNSDTEPNGTDQFDRELNYQQKITDIQKHYYNEFLKVLPPEKASQVFKSERDFKFELLRRLKEGRRPLGN